MRTGSLNKDNGKTPLTKKDYLCKQLYGQIYSVEMSLTKLCFRDNRAVAASTQSLAVAAKWRFPGCEHPHAATAAEAGVNLGATPDWLALAERAHSYLLLSSILMSGLIPFHPWPVLWLMMREICLSNTWGLVMQDV